MTSCTRSGLVVAGRGPGQHHDAPVRPLAAVAEPRTAGSCRSCRLPLLLVVAGHAAGATPYCSLREAITPKCLARTKITGEEYMHLQSRSLHLARTSTCPTSHRVPAGQKGRVFASQCRHCPTLNSARSATVGAGSTVSEHEPVALSIRSRGPGAASTLKLGHDWELVPWAQVSATHETNPSTYGVRSRRVLFGRRSRKPCFSLVSPGI